MCDIRRVKVEHEMLFKLISKLQLQVGILLTCLEFLFGAVGGQSGSKGFKQGFS